MNRGPGHKLQTTNHKPQILNQIRFNILLISRFIKAQPVSQSGDLRLHVLNPLQ